MLTNFNIENRKISRNLQNIYEPLTNIVNSFKKLVSTYKLKTRVHLNISTAVQSIGRFLQMFHQVVAIKFWNWTITFTQRYKVSVRSCKIWNYRLQTNFKIVGKYVQSFRMQLQTSHMLLQTSLTSWVIWLVNSCTNFTRSIQSSNTNTQAKAKIPHHL